MTAPITYLHKGFKVVGVEANPLAVPLLRHRFEAEIAQGRYVLLPLGVAKSAGEAPFWICDYHPKGAASIGASPAVPVRGTTA